MNQWPRQAPHDVETMNRSKYQITGKGDHEIWVCDACKKVNNDLILMGKWKLIDRCSDCSTVQCDVCGDTEKKGNS